MHLSWLVLGASAVVQLVAGVVRTRGWWHVIRDSREEWCDLPYRAVVLGHLGGVGWNAILPARAGDAVKIALVNRRMRDRHVTTLAATLVPPALVEAALTVLLVAGLLATGVTSFATIADGLPGAQTVLIAGAAAVAVVIAAVILRRRVRYLVDHVREGLSVLARPRIVATHVLPWALAGRVLRLLAFALVLSAAGLPLALDTALALMALQGATPSAGAAATAARIGLLAIVLSRTGATTVPASHVAEALAAAYGVTSGVNLAVTGAVMAWELRTLSPRRFLEFGRSAARGASKRRRPAKPAQGSRDH